MHFWLVGS
ncbi:hypothetical protein QTG54_013128 [Skeletonema marinoi]|uniref:Uncharacterized protein n=1 Tax=Skeletonema marinoi TaxID=267567 RepID=A0AAD8XYD1_9STRA|nr:hypothetical protein QTG54_013128 [Skeletonema marinoi]